MAKTDLQVRPIYRRPRDSVEAHLTIVFAVIAVSRGSNTRPAGPHTVAAADPCPAISGRLSIKSTADQLRTYVAVTSLVTQTQHPAESAAQQISPGLRS